MTWPADVYLGQRINIAIQRGKAVIRKKKINIINKKARAPEEPNDRDTLLAKSISF